MMLLNRFIKRSQMIFLFRTATRSMTSDIIDDFVKSQTTNRISSKPKITKSVKLPKSMPGLGTANGTDSAAKSVSESNKLFLMVKADAGIELQFPKLPHNFLLLNSDYQVITKFRETTLKFPTLSIFCDGASRQKVSF